MNTREAVLISREAGETVKVSLQRVTVDAAVRDVSSAVTVTQVYLNTEDRAIEAVYCFPVEESAAICGFEIETGGRTISGITEEKEKAFETYDKALADGNAAFLLDQEAQDILHISVGNIKPGQEVLVRISYISELPVTDGIIRLQIPATLSPRYSPADSDPVAADRINPPRSSAVPYSMEMTVRADRRSIFKAVSPSHRITSTENGDQLLVRLAEGTAGLDRDFILELETVKQSGPVCTAARHANGEAALLLRFFPELEELTSRTDRRSEIIFLIDCSGSMEGSSIAEAKQAMELSLRSLNEGDLFNIVRFGSAFDVFSPESLVYGTDSLRRALKYITATGATMGGTELLPAVRHACSLPYTEGFLRDLVLITDGEVSNPDQVINTVAGHYGKLRVFSFGIGYGASHHLVKGTARASGGAYEMIQPGEKVQPKVLRQFSRMSQPFLTDITVTGKGVSLEVPYKLPPLFDGDSYTLYARIGEARPEAEIALTGKYLGRTFAWSAKLGPLAEDNTVPALWALYHIKMLKEGSGGGSAQAGRKEQLIVKQITDLGLKFSLMTDYTSFVAVEERAEAEKTSGLPEFRRIPVMLTKDWHGTRALQEQADFSALAGSVGGGLGMPILMAEAAPSSKRGLFRFSAPKARAKKGDSGMKMQKLAPSAGMSNIMPEAALRFDRTEDAKEKGGEWYLDLLSTQEAEGYFTGLPICAEQLGAEVRLLKEAAGKLDKLDPKLKEQVFTTWLAVRLLEQDQEIRSVSGRAIRKAKTWLAEAAPNLTIAGLSPEQYLGEKLNLRV